MPNYDVEGDDINVKNTMMKLLVEENDELCRLDIKVRISVQRN